MLLPFPMPLLDDFGCCNIFLIEHRPCAQLFVYIKSLHCERDFFSFFILFLPFCFISFHSFRFVRSVWFGLFRLKSTWASLESILYAFLLSTLSGHNNQWTKGWAIYFCVSYLWMENALNHRAINQAGMNEVAAC